MRRLGFVFSALAATLAGAVSARADGPTPPPAPATSPYIDWQPSLVAAFEAGKKEGKPIFIAINAERVDGKARIEPAGKELRENTYRDPAVVAKSRQFACALVKPDANTADYAELRSHFAIDGVVVSPQHIFAHADGTLIDRKEYWSYGAGSASVDALIAMMDAALVAHRAKGTLSPSGAAPTGTAEERRAAWIRERLQRVRDGSTDRAGRDVAVAELVKGDKGGDCVTPLCALLLEVKKDPDTQVAIVRALGKPGLEAALPAVTTLLDDSSDDVRSNAAVTLEYIGSAASVDAITKRLGKEKDELARNDLCRALGHCGEKQEAVRKTLLRELATAKNNKTSAGPAIGLAYFVHDAEAARGIEKILAGGVDWQKRAFMLYALTEIRDPKSKDFVAEKVLKSEKNLAAMGFLNAVLSLLSGSDDAGTAQRAMESGVGSAIGTLGEIGGSAREGRDQREFAPKGEIAARKGRGR